MPVLINKEVLEKCQAGDREGFRALFEAYRERVYGIALYFAGDTASAKDVAQEVFLKLFTCIKQYRGDASFDTWLYRLVVNCCIDERRKRRRFLPLDFLLGRTSMERDAATEHNHLRVEISDVVQLAVQKLKPKLRVPIILRYVEELSYEQIAAVLGCSQGTVASRLNRAHRALARRLGHLLDRTASGRTASEKSHVV
jgi:RNA polymerase sigma-70 factor (ECF subfamily)